VVVLRGATPATHSNQHVKIESANVPWLGRSDVNLTQLLNGSATVEDLGWKQKKELKEQASDRKGRIKWRLLIKDIKAFVRVIIREIQ
jgi:hypothetical protein